MSKVSLVSGGVFRQFQYNPTIMSFSTLLKIPDRDYVVFLGDTHSVQSTTDCLNRVHKLVSRADISDACVWVIHVGDTGFSFSPYKIQAQLGHVAGMISKRNIRLLAIRGNHDRAVLFDGSFASQDGRVRLIRDYTRIHHLGYEYLLVGGAISVDRMWSLAKGDPYDPNEGSIKCPPEVSPTVGKERWVIAHDVPDLLFKSVGAEIAKFDLSRVMEKDPTLGVDLLENRKRLDEVLLKYQPRRWIAGHYHVTYNNDFVGFGGLRLQILNIQELMPVHCY